MSSFFDYYQNFIQNKEIGRVVVATELPEEQRSIDNNDSLSTTTASSVGAADTSNDSSQMEHSYMRDSTVINTKESGLTPARSVLVRRAPQCSSCHTHPQDEHELNEANYTSVPVYDEILAKESMHECARIAKYVMNANSDDDDWQAHVNQSEWSYTQQTVFKKVVRILDYDQLARLANDSRPHEAIQRRATIDKSATRMRRVLASIAWEPRVTQWLHALLMDSLPATYMASYLDIMQTLKTKLPTLTDKMLFSRPLLVSQELLAPVMKRQWAPIMNPKSRQLTHNAIIVVLPTLPSNGAVPERIQNWYKNLSSITQLVQITLPNSNDRIAQQSLEQVAETIVSLTRVKIHDLRTENPNRGVILIGFNAGSALALQVAMSESIACVVCMGFAYNTLNGIRGNPDDRLLDIKAPILFVIGQNSARTSQEEMECLREKMQSESSLVIVGSADDALRIPKSRRQLENVTQAMVDSMVVDEVYDFITRTLANPPGPRLPAAFNQSSYFKTSKTILGADGGVGGKMLTSQQRKRKQDGSLADIEGVLPAKAKYVTHKLRTPKIPKLPKPKPSRFIDPFAAKRKVGRPRTRPLYTGPGPVGSNIACKVPKLKSTQQQQATTPGTTKVNEEISGAMQTILTDPNDMEASTSNVIANIEKVIPAGKLKTVTGINTLQQKPTIITSGAGGVKPTGLGTAKIKMIPANQFLQLKSLQPQSKLYTINKGQVATSAASIGSIVKTMPTAASTGQQQIFTLKSPNGQTTQFVTAAPPTAQQKYTVIKNVNGTTSLQLTKNIGAGATTSATATATTATAVKSNLDLSNIIDMPIIFADGDGSHLAEQKGGGEALKKQQLAGAKPANVGKLIISQKIIKEASSTSAGGITSMASTIMTTGGAGKPIIINKSTTLSGLTGQLGTTSTGKFVYLNRSNMKPCTNILTRTTGGAATALPQYAKILVTNAKANERGEQPTIVKAVSLQSLNKFTTNMVTTVAGTSAGAGATATTNIPRTTSGIVNVGNNKIHVISASSAATAATTTTRGGLISIGGDKPTQIRNIVLKPGGLKQIPQHLGNQLLNRNLTVRKLNIVPPNKVAGFSKVSPSVTIATQPHLQTDTPKIIKLSTTSNKQSNVE